MEQSLFWEATSHSASQEIPTFYGPEGLLPCSQEPASGPCPKPDETTPHLPTLFP
jgi:hypothetical protein